MEIGLIFTTLASCINTSTMRLKMDDLLYKFLLAVHYEYTIEYLEWRNRERGFKRVGNE